MSPSAIKHASAVKLAAHLRQTAQQLEILASQLNRATRTLPKRCQLTQLVFDGGKPLEDMTIAELLPLVARVGT